MPDRPAVLFVCLGNICRSPLAEAAFRVAANRAGLEAEADSAGTAGWHVGNPPDVRAQAVAEQMGCPIGHLRARQVCAADFERFSYVVAMDRDNLRALQHMQPIDSTAEVKLLLDYAVDRAGQEVADPYYGGPEGFAVTWSDVSSGAKGLVDRLLSQG
jgi:protein-tyrosine phosphatase